MHTHVFDACSLINLMATGRELEILVALDVEVLIVDTTLGEAQGLNVFGTNRDKRTREPINYDGLRSASRLRVVPRSSVPAHERVRLSAYLRDADALPVGLAIEARVPLVTDDKLVRNTVENLAKDLGLKSTYELLLAAHTACHWSKSDLLAVTRSVAERGAFEPPNWDRAADRVRDALRQSGPDADRDRDL